MKPCVQSACFRQPAFHFYINLLEINCGVAFGKFNNGNHSFPEQKCKLLFFKVLLRTRGIMLDVLTFGLMLPTT